ncbi:MAG: hypothetical protein ACR2HY_04865 [Acidimicrobiales bacterium]
MGNRVVVESKRDRRALVADAGWGQVSVPSLAAGTLVAYGAFAVLAGATGGVLAATDSSTDITARWGDLGVAPGLVVAGLLLVSYLFGGYVAGRMARRAGVAHGIGVFVLGVVVVGALAVIIRQAAGTEAVVGRLRDLGLPTSASEWRHVGTVAGLASLAAALVGALAGGALGERWHARLLSRALDPDVGAEAEARRQAELAAAEARVHHTGAHERVDTASLRQLRDDQPTEGTEIRDEERRAGFDPEAAALARRREELAAEHPAVGGADTRTGTDTESPASPPPAADRSFRGSATRNVER